MSKENPVDITTRLDEIDSRLAEIDDDIDELKQEYDTLNRDFTALLRSWTWDRSHDLPPPDYHTVIRKEIELALKNKLSERPADASNSNP